MNEVYSKIILNLTSFDMETEHKKNFVHTFDSELLSYLYVLGGADKKISSSELEYINMNFNIFLTKDTFKDHTTYWVKREGKYCYDSPIIFYLLNEILNEKNASLINETYDLIFKLYKDVGLEYLSLDDELTEREVNWYTEFISSFALDFQKYNSKSKNILSYILDDYIDVDPAPEVEPIDSVEEVDELELALGELNELIGLGNVKTEIDMLINLIKVRKLREERGFKNPTMSYHMVFSGNPGTGKTTVARILAKIYKALGVLSKGTLYETDRSGLVAGYIGQTAEKTIEVCNESLGGILFIDEAYALTDTSSENDYGKEAVNTLLKFMEDNRDDLIVIVAGYTDLMKEFVESNPGLKSRFNKYIDFPDYSNDELIKIFLSLADKNNYKLNKAGKTKLLSILENMTVDEFADFGNGRGIRNLFEKAVTNQATRISKCINITDSKLLTLNDKDVEL